MSSDGVGVALLINGSRGLRCIVQKLHDLAIRREFQADEATVK